MRIESSPGGPRPATPAMVGSPPLRADGFGGWGRVLLVAWLAVSGAAAAAAEEDKEPGWLGALTLGYVSTGGNSEAETLSLEIEVEQIRRGGFFRLQARGLRAETTNVRRFAVRSGDEPPSLVEVTSTNRTTDRYEIRIKNHQRISDRWYWYAGGEWDRNEPAGIRNRYAVLAGAGNTWFENERGHFWTDYGLSANRERESDEGIQGALEYLAFRFTADYLRQLFSHSEVGSVLVVDQNLDETDDLRARMNSWLEVAISDRLGVRLALDLFWDDNPTLLGVPVVDGAGQPTGERIRVPLDDLDTIFTASLTLSF